MNTLLLHDTPQDIARAAELLQQGELVAFPTETVYGLGADARRADSVRAVFAAKGRPADNPLIVHIAEVSQFMTSRVRCRTLRCGSLSSSGRDR